MDITRTFYAPTRKEWRAWLAKHYATRKEIWLVYPRAGSGKRRIPYADAVEEAICFGWIDGIIKRMDEARSVQRFTPRRDRSFLSETNKERARKMIAAGLMTPAGLAKIADKLNAAFVPPDDVVAALKKNGSAWRNFRKFSPTYQRIRLGWVDASRRNPEVFLQRLNHLVKMSALNKQFGELR